MIAAIYARKSTDQNLARRREERHPPGGARDGLRRAQGLDRGHGARLQRRRDHRRGVR